MSRLFLSVLNMSISAGWIVIAVLVFRLLLKKAPRQMTVLLWGLVGLRLVCPFKLESAISLIPSAETVSPDIMTDPLPEIDSGITLINQAINPIISGSLTPSPETSANPLQSLIPVLAAIWLFGAAFMLVYMAASYLGLRKKVGSAVPLRENIFRSDAARSPFVLGIFKPRIYLPFNLSEEASGYVIAHERAHIRRKDHILKPVGFLILAFHWFNPLIWVGYAVFCRDIELACDESVIKGLEPEFRADYSEALLSLSVVRRAASVCPLAFGEVGVKERVKSVLGYKKPAVWIIIAASAVLAFTVLCLLTSPEKKKPELPSGMALGEVYSEYKGVNIEIENAEIVDGKLLLSVKWKNNSFFEAVYGAYFEIEREKDGEWVSCSKRELVYILIAYGLRAGMSEAREYSLSDDNFDLSAAGNYRIRSSFSIYENGKGAKPEKYGLWAEFSLSEDFLAGE